MGGAQSGSCIRQSVGVLVFSCCKVAEFHMQYCCNGDRFGMPNNFSFLHTPDNISLESRNSSHIHVHSLFLLLLYDFCVVFVYQFYFLFEKWWKERSRF